MDRNRLARGLGWMSVGLGLTDLVLAEGLCRRLALGRRAALVRVMGARELASGLGLLMSRRPRSWVLARVAGDALDLSLLGAALSRRRRARAWQLGTLAGAVGLTLLDVYAASTFAEGPRRPERARAPLPEDLSPAPYAPAESWRGSGLAEDVGVAHEETAEEDPAAREQRMREAQRRLGLPDPDSRVSHV
ncbi:hypothetical protein FGE12_05375 [Aggregicoccus sp. 17bor-14]|uniref:hypothetical protein n=1 Tax=Myxococcaceae TaxID=31 RepID=UPI00129CFC0F|nr:MULTISPECIES: hypothetical protein [Myxococcaceae]MBF5041812.1 hypothetical protein [Simulacricoccus sp. 17bor-14]MRI87593.1 hypothetical protein [Aggregicoccus sp. 17bor-14]